MARADVPALRKGLGYYEQAVALDPKFAEAWARVSSCRALLFTNSVADPALAARRDGGRAASRSSSRRTSRTAQMALGNVLPRRRAEIRRAPSRNTGRPRSSPRGLPILCARSAAPRCRWAAGRTRSRTTTRPSAWIRRTRSTSEIAAQPLVVPAALRRGADRPSIAPWPSLRRTSLGSAEAAVLLCDGESRPRAPSSRKRLAESAPPRRPRIFSGGSEWLFDAETFALLRRLTPAAFDDDEAAWANAQAWAAWRAGDSARRPRRTRRRPSRFSRPTPGTRPESLCSAPRPRPTARIRRPEGRGDPRGRPRDRARSRRDVAFSGAEALVSTSRRRTCSPENPTKPSPRSSGS